MTNDFKGMFDVRDMVDEDKNLIYATFLRGVYYGNSWFSLIPKDIFMQQYKKVIESLINKAVIKVACLKDDPNTVLGYSILSQDYSIIHYVYVKSVWRNRGISKAILPQYPTAVTHLTELGKNLLPKFKNCIFNPFLV